MGVSLKRSEIGQFSGFWAWWQSINLSTNNRMILVHVWLYQKKIWPLSNFCNTKHTEFQASDNGHWLECMKIDLEDPSIDISVYFLPFPSWYRVLCWWGFADDRLLWQKVQYCGESSRNQIIIKVNPNSHNGMLIQNNFQMEILSLMIPKSFMV